MILIEIDQKSKKFHLFTVDLMRFFLQFSVCICRFLVAFSFCLLFLYCFCYYLAKDFLLFKIWYDTGNGIYLKRFLSSSPYGTNDSDATDSAQTWPIHLCVHCVGLVSFSAQINSDAQTTLTYLFLILYSVV